MQALNKEIEDYKRQISQNAVEVALLKSDLDSFHNPSPRTNSSNSVAKLEESITKLQVVLLAQLCHPGSIKLSESIVI